MQTVVELYGVDAEAGVEIPSHPSRNSGVIARKMAFLELVKDTKEGRLDLQDIADTKTRNAVLQRLTSIHMGGHVLFGASENKYYKPKGNSLVKPI